MTLRDIIWNSATENELRSNVNEIQRTCRISGKGRRAMLRDARERREQGFPVRVQAAPQPYEGALDAVGAAGCHLTPAFFRATSDT